WPQVPLLCQGGESASPEVRAMTNIHRRGFLLGVGGASLAAVTPPQPMKMQSADNVTRTLARYVVSAKVGDLPTGVRKEAKRTLLNWIGCALGGSRHETVDAAVAALMPFSGPAQASLLGRKERLDVLHTAMINGISSHVLDFDDTHPTIIHPAGPVASVILALSEYRRISGSDAMNALVLGVEPECR